MHYSADTGILELTDLDFRRELFDDEARLSPDAGIAVRLAALAGVQLDIRTYYVSKNAALRACKTASPQTKD